LESRREFSKDKHKKRLSDVLRTKNLTKHNRDSNAVELITILLEICGQGPNETVVTEQTKGFFRFFQQHFIHHHELQGRYSNESGAGRYPQWRKLWELLGVAEKVGAAANVEEFKGEEFANAWTYRWAIEQAIFITLIKNEGWMTPFFYQLYLKARYTGRTKKEKAIFADHSIADRWVPVVRDYWSENGELYHANADGNLEMQPCASVEMVDEHICKNREVYLRNSPWNFSLSALENEQRSRQSANRQPGQPNAVSPSNSPSSRSSATVEGSAGVGQPVWKTNSNGSMGMKMLNIAEAAATLDAKLRSVNKELVDILVEHPAEIEALTAFALYCVNLSKEEDVDLSICHFLVDKTLELKLLDHKSGEAIKTRTTAWNDALSAGIPWPQTYNQDTSIETGADKAPSSPSVQMRKPPISVSSSQVHANLESLMSYKVPSVERRRMDGQATVAVYRNEENKTKPWQEVYYDSSIMVSQQYKVNIPGLLDMGEGRALNDGFGETSYNLVSIHPTPLGILSGMKAWSYSIDADIAKFMKEALGHLCDDERMDAIPIPDTEVKRALSGCTHVMSHFEHIDVLGNGTYGLVCKSLLGGADGVIVAIKFEFFSVDELRHFILSLYQATRVRHIGVAKILSYFPVEVKPIKERCQNHFQEVLKVNIALVQECGECTLYDKIVEIHEHMESLKRMFTGGRITVELYNVSMTEVLKEVWEILDHLLDVVSALAAKGITHRDLKPINIIFSGGVWKIIDFGEARHRPKFIDELSFLRGTDGYMPPLEGGRSPKHDPYSLGCIGYEMLAGPCKVPDNADLRARASMEQIFQDMFCVDDSLVPIISEFADILSQMTSVREEINDCSIEAVAAKAMTAKMRRFFI
jgi:Protein kinase domain